MKEMGGEGGGVGVGVVGSALEVAFLFSIWSQRFI